MIAGLLILLVLVALAAAAVFLPRLLRGELGALREQTASDLSARNAEVELRLQGMEKTLSTRLSELDTKVDGRLAASTQTPTQIHERLGEMTKATETMIAQGAGSRATRAGAAPTQGPRRLRRAPPRESAARPAPARRLRDAVHVRERRPGRRRDPRRQALPVDSKFPLDNFERWSPPRTTRSASCTRRRSRATSRGTSTRSRRKYILPDVGTFDFALHVPAGRGDLLRARLGKTGHLLAYAHERRVFPVSATTFAPTCR